MTVTWDTAAPPPDHRPSGVGLVRAGLRGALILCVILIGLTAFLPLRLLERARHGARRPWTPWITQSVCRCAVWLMGLRLNRRGRPAGGLCVVVANHSSWLDIFVLNACDRVTFVSKAEVSGWPGIGFLAQVTGTLFITRDPKAAQAQTAQFEQRLAQGDRLLFFPEGTSTDGLRVLPFKSTLFAAFFAPAFRAHLVVQPVSVTYHAPPGYDARLYGWWGDMSFARHLLATLAVRRRGTVDVVYHPPLALADMPNRKALAAQSEAAVRAGHGHAGRALDAPAQ